MLCLSCLTVTLLQFLWSPKSNIRHHRGILIIVIGTWCLSCTQISITTTGFQLSQPKFLPLGLSLSVPNDRIRTIIHLKQYSTQQQVDETRCSTTIGKHKMKLQNVVCLVTGASRGIGKGIALELGSQGAIVYITGTTTTMTTASDSNADDDETIESTAYEIQQLGGIGIPIRCDHTNDTEVYNVIQQIETDYGHLDILVNNAFRFPIVTSTSDDKYAAGTNVATSTMEFLLRRKFWQQGALAWDTIHTVGLRSHYITTCAAMPLLFRARDKRKSLSTSSMTSRPLIVMISSFGGLTYSFNVAYGVGKAGVDRMVKDMAYELATEDICIVSLWPGVVNTERTQRSVQNGEWDKYVQLSLELSETPQFTGRAIVALATDLQNIQKSGSVQVVAELATEYDFTDIDGCSVPPSIRSLRFLLYNYFIQTNPILQNRIPFQWIPDIRIPFWLMAQGSPPTSDSDTTR